MKKSFLSVFASILVLAAGSVVLGQTLKVSMPVERQMPVAAGSNLYCAGYVQTAPMNTPSKKNSFPSEIVGAYDEQDGMFYSQNKDLVMSGGENKDIHVGDKFSVVRPRGEVHSRYTEKGRLGYYVQELGSVEVVKVQQDTSVVRVKNSCDVMLLGDLLVPYESRVSAPFVQRPALDRFANASGKASGRIFLARDGQETITRDQIVYVDLGADNNVAAGDYLTIFRPLGKGNLLLNNEDEAVSSRDYGFESDEYRGGTFSNQASRKAGSQADSHMVTLEDAKGSRPHGLRKVVGEGMVVNVRERTATVVITRTSQEIHTGDWVELQ